MSRIYVVTHRDTGAVIRYVRGQTLNGAVRAVADEHFEARAATTDEIYLAMQAGAFDVLDAMKPEQADIEDALDPGPVPLRAAQSA